jgi:nicotinate-nucleotide pyrophosphorylase (carboxylating)
VNWNTPEIRALVRSALQEDNARQDITTHLLIDPHWKVDAVLVSKQKGVIAGLPLAERLFKGLDPALQFRSLVADGVPVRAGERLASIKGKARSVLSGERPALNALQHLSGIATFARAQVQKLKGTPTKLYDTRKTLPGWRQLQKYAVRCGGAQNHRQSLADFILIKENHLKLARLAGSDWPTRIRRVLLSHRPIPVQIEIQTKQDLQDTLHIKPQRVLLDNLPTRQLKSMIKRLRREIPGIEIEVSGGVKPENLRALARLGPDRISMGRLTHTVSAFDCSLDILRVYPH